MNRMSHKRIMEVIYAFEIGGSERLAAAIAEKISQYGESVSVCAINGDAGPIRTQLEKNNISCYGIGGGDISALAVRYRLYKLFKQVKPDVLHMHHITQLIHCYWPAKLANVPRLVVTEHANYSLRTVKKLNRRAKFYTKRADALTVVHSGLKDYFEQEMEVPAEMITTITNGVDTRIYTPGDASSEFKASIGIPDDVAVLACIGRLVEAKDHQNLLNAARFMVEKGHTDFRLLIVGDGPYRQQLERHATEQGLNGNVLFLGARSDIVDILHNTDICVLSSKREGFPMVLLEAMGCGVPCVSTQVGGVFQLINDSNGRIVPPEESIALAEALISLYKDREAILKLGAAARETIVSGYEIEDVLNSYKQILVNG